MEDKILNFVNQLRIFCLFRQGRLNGYFIPCEGSDMVTRTCVLCCTPAQYLLYHETKETTIYCSHRDKSFSRATGSHICKGHAHEVTGKLKIGCRSYREMVLIYIYISKEKIYLSKSCGKERSHTFHFIKVKSHTFHFINVKSHTFHKFEVMHFIS